MLALLPILLLLSFDLDAVRKEPNLEKRSELAMKNADTAASAVRDATQKGDDEKLKDSLSEMRASVNLAVESLEAAKVDPRNSKYYKRAEQSASQLVRRLDSLIQSTSIVDQEVIKPERDHISDVHDKLLTSIMARKKK